MYASHQPYPLAPVQNPPRWVLPVVVLGAVTAGAVGYMLLRPSPPATRGVVKPTSLPQVRLNVAGATIESVHLEAADLESSQLSTFDSGDTKVVVATPTDIVVSLPSTATSNMYVVGLERSFGVDLLQGDLNPGPGSPRDWLFRISPAQETSIVMTISDGRGGQRPLKIDGIA